MKCEINCDDCARRWRGLRGKYQGEHIKQRVGAALNPYKCDGCGQELAEGQRVHATTLYTRDRPYSPWEEDFIREDTPP